MKNGKKTQTVPSGRKRNRAPARVRKTALSSTPRTARHWIVKQEPTAYSWESFVHDGGTQWTGVRNPQARLNLRAMRVGDPVLFYHSVIGKEVVGLARVSRESYPDPAAPEWVAVDLVPVRPLTHRVTLAQMKDDPMLHDLLLVRQSRLSVVPLSATQFQRILELATMA
jgi:predicted RNA-binding protein with PUA-like domain